MQNLWKSITPYTLTRDVYNRSKWEYFMEENNLQETQLEHDPILKENINWDQAVQKIETVINDVCKEYEKDGHPYYAESLLKHWRRVLKG